MTTVVERILSAAGAIVLAMAFGAALSAVPTFTQAQADDPPIDCKMKPDDPRCKEGKKY